MLDRNKEACSSDSHCDASCVNIRWYRYRVELTLKTEKTGPCVTPGRLPATALSVVGCDAFPC